MLNAVLQFVYFTNDDRILIYSVHNTMHFHIRSTLIKCENNSEACALASNLFDFVECVCVFFSLLLFINQRKKHKALLTKLSNGDFQSNEDFSVFKTLSTVHVIKLLRCGSDF